MGARPSLSPLGAPGRGPDSTDYDDEADTSVESMPAVPALTASDAERGGDGADPLAQTPIAEAARPRFDRYELRRELGRGGMGVVHEAIDLALHRRVALKLLHDRANGEDGERAQARLLREARSMASLSHPNVVPVFDVGVVEGRVFVAMELGSGSNLRDWASARPRSFADRLGMLLDAGRGLAAAHAAGIVHRDFKPDNVLISRRGVAQVTDFGLARRTDADVAVALDSAAATPMVDAATGITVTGAVVGTPAYLSPEQVFGQPATMRGDQFAFCVTAWELFAGQRPFQGATAHEVMARIGAGEFTPAPAEKTWPIALREVLLRGLSRDPNARFPTMDALVEELALVVPRSRRRRRFVVAGLAAIPALAFAAWAWTRPATPAAPAAPTPGSFVVTALPQPPEAAGEPSPSTPTQPAPIAASQALAAPAADGGPMQPSPRVNLPPRRGTPRNPSVATSPQTATTAPASPVPAELAAPARDEGREPVAKVDAVAAGREQLRALDTRRQARALLTSDLAGWSTAMARARQELEAGEHGSFARSLADLGTALDGLRVDAAFVNAKAARLGREHDAKRHRLSAEDDAALGASFQAAIGAMATDDTEAANRHLTRVAQILVRAR